MVIFQIPSDTAYGIYGDFYPKFERYLEGLSSSSPFSPRRNRRIPSEDRFTSQGCLSSTVSTGDGWKLSGISGFFNGLTINQEMVIFHGINWGIRWDKFLKINWGHLHPTNIRLLIMVIFHGVSMVILVMGIQDVQ